MSKTITNLCFYCGSPVETVIASLRDTTKIQDAVCLSVKPCVECTKKFADLGIIALVEGRRMPKLERAKRAQKFNASSATVRQILNYPGDFIDEATGRYLLVREKSFANMDPDTYALALKIRFILMEPEVFSAHVAGLPAKAQNNLRQSPGKDAN